MEVYAVTFSHTPVVIKSLEVVLVTVSTNDSVDAIFVSLRPAPGITKSREIVELTVSLMGGNIPNISTPSDVVVFTVGLNGTVVCVASSDVGNETVGMDLVAVVVAASSNFSSEALFDETRENIVLAKTAAAVPVASVDVPLISLRGDSI